MCTDSLQALSAAWLDASQRSRDGVWLNMSVREKSESLKCYEQCRRL